MKTRSSFVSNSSSSSFVISAKLNKDNCKNEKDFKKKLIEEEIKKNYDFDPKKLAKSIVESGIENGNYDNDDNDENDDKKTLKLSWTWQTSEGCLSIEEVIATHLFMGGKRKGKLDFAEIEFLDNEY